MVTPARPDQLSNDGDADADGGESAASDGPRTLRQLTHDRLGQLGHRPRHALGQNFLVSDDVMRRIEEFAAVTDQDVVLEIGGGLGVLTERLAATAAHVHVIELDEALAGLLEELTDRDRVTVHRGDAVKLDLAGLQPTPTALIANLPYSVAATVVLRAVHEVPSIERALVMVQKEVGVRFAARAGTKEYGAPSAIAQLSGKVKLERDVSPSAFRPQPRVHSVLMRWTRTGPPADPALRRLVHAAFAHRRKALPKALAIGIGDARVRDETKLALVAMGLPDDARGEQLDAAQFTQLHAALAAAGVGGMG